MSITISAYTSNNDPLTPASFVQAYDEYGCETNQNPWEMNVANDNFMSLMGIIGIDADYFGSWGDGSLQNVMDAVKFALESIKAMPELDCGKRNQTTFGGNGATIIEWGIRAGYYQDCLGRLETIIGAALAHDCTVCWC